MQATKCFDIFRTVESLFQLLEEREIGTAIRGCCNTCTSKGLEDDGKHQYAHVHDQVWDCLAESEDETPDLYAGFSDETVAEAILEECSTDEWLQQWAVAQWNGDVGTKVRLSFFAEMDESREDETEDMLPDNVVDFPRAKE